MKSINGIISVLCILLFAAAASGQQAAWRQKLAPDVRTAYDRGAKSSFLVVLNDRADLTPARAVRGKNAKAVEVAGRLQDVAARSQANVLRLVREHAAAANSLWLVNAVAVEDAGPALVAALADLPEVRALAADPWIAFTPPGSPVVADGSAPAADRSTIEWGVQRINAPAVWSLGYTGQGVTIGGADTGYDWLHPALLPHYRGWNATSGTADHSYNWHDAIDGPGPLNGDSLNPCGYNVLQPCDDGSHGTHTMGTMAGDDGQGNQIGVAPGAKWVGCRNMERGWGRPSSYLECFQWFLAPTDLDGANPDPSKAPWVINNSWYCADIEGCTDAAIEDLLRQAIIALKAAGTVVVVSNGNNGPGCGTASEPPAYFAESFSIGATRWDDTIASFSSRGPVVVDTSFRVKPDVAAPGQDVRSSVPNNGYANFSGTSMAGPHVAGLVALLLSARPDLAGEVELIENIVRQTAMPLYDAGDCLPVSGLARPNHVYGFGRVDALAAVEAILIATPVGEPSDAATAVVFPNPAHETVHFRVRNLAGAVTLELFDAAGRRVLTRQWTAAGADTFDVPLAGLPPGVYGWQITGASGVAGGKLVRQ